MNFSHLLVGDSFNFIDSPEVTYIKMSKHTYRAPFTENPAPVPLSVRGDPEVEVRHEGFETFAQLRIGDEFRFTERRTLLCRKSGLNTYRILNCPPGFEEEDFGDFGDPLVVRESNNP
jgi:hypothetical protein